MLLRKIAIPIACMQIILRAQKGKSNRPNRLHGNQLLLYFLQVHMVHNSPYYRAVRLWDQLPVEIHRATKKGKFKTAIG